TDTAALRGFGLTFDPDVFPVVWLWMVYGGWRGYYHAICEPWTGYPSPLAEAVEAGRARVLDPGGVLETSVSAVVYAGVEAGQLYRFGLGGGAVETVATAPGGFLLGLAVDAVGSVYACDPNAGHVLRISPGGEVEPFGDRVGYPNYPVFDGDGNLWVTDSGTWDEVSGGLVRIPPDGSTERVAGPFRFANGLAISGDHLYM